MSAHPTNRKRGIPHRLAFALLTLLLPLPNLHAQGLEQFRKAAAGVRVIKGEQLPDENGSGFVVSADNGTVYVLTARHLFYKGTDSFTQNIEVTFYIDQLHVQKAVLARDFPTLDVALLAVGNVGDAAKKENLPDSLIAQFPKIPVRPDWVSLGAGLFVVGGSTQQWQIVGVSVSDTADGDNVDRFRFSGTGFHDGYSGSGVVDAEGHLAGVHLGKVEVEEGIGHAQGITKAIAVLTKLLSMNRLGGPEGVPPTAPPKISSGIVAAKGKHSDRGDEQSAIRHSSENAVAGSQWRVLPSGTPEHLRSITGTPNGIHLWAVGDRGTILQSDDAGETWRTGTSGTAYQTYHLHSIFSTADGGHLWAVGEDFMVREQESKRGIILRSDDHGATWKVSKSGTTGTLDSIFGTADGEHLWAVSRVFNWPGAVIVQSDDSGATWRERGGWNASQLDSIFGTADGNHLWVAGDFATWSHSLTNNILQSDNAGATWKTRAIVAAVTRAYALHSISGTSDGRHLWVVGGDKEGIILQSDDGGATWQMRLPSGSSPLYSTFGTPDGKHLWAVGGYLYGSEGTVVQSDDGGVTWQARKCGRSQYNAPFSMNSIFGTADGKHLWAVGSEGTILQSDASNP